MRKIGNWLTKNIFWKLLSLFLAILIWFFVINIQNPEQTRTYEVAVKLLSLDELHDQRLTLTNQAKLENTKIKVHVRGKRMALDRLDDKRNEITAVINTVIMRGSQISAPINYSIDIQLPNTGPNDRFEATSEPYYLEGNIDSIVTIPKKVDVFPIGTVANGYDEISTEVFPAYINLTGAESVVNKVASVKVNVDIDGAKSDVSLTAAPKLYDSLGNEILGLVRDKEKVDINIKINKYSKVPLLVTNRGTPQDGFVITDIKWEPEHVELVGSEDEINALKELKIQLNLQGKSESEEFTFDLRQLLPSTAISIKNGTTNQAVVQVTIQPLGQKQVMFSTDNITIAGRVIVGAEYYIKPQDIVLTISGLKDLVQGVTSDNISASVNITDYAEGIHNIPLTIVLPTGITIVSETPSVIVEIKTPDSETNETPEPMDNETSEPTDNETSEPTDNETSEPEYDGAAEQDDVPTQD